MSIRIICIRCKKIFYARPKQKFCSRKCSNNIPWNKGKTGIYSKKTIEKMRIWQTGRKRNFSKNHRENLSKALKGNQNCLGNIPSKETREKIGKAQLGNLNHRWRGGRRKSGNGYFVIYSPTHPFKIGNYVAEHRLIMEKHLGRYLNPEEVVHHINNNHSDNHIENLMLFANGSEHRKFHIKNRK